MQHYNRFQPAEPATRCPPLAEIAWLLFFWTIFSVSGIIRLGWLAGRLLAAGLLRLSLLSLFYGILALFIAATFIVTASYLLIALCGSFSLP